MNTRTGRMDLRQADRELVELVKDLRILGQLSWPREEQYRFLSDWRAGRRELPAIHYPRLELGDADHRTAQNHQITPGRQSARLSFSTRRRVPTLRHAACWRAWARPS